MKTPEISNPKIAEWAKSLDAIVDSTSSASKEELDALTKSLDKSIEQGRKLTDDFTTEIESFFSTGEETIRQRFEALSKKASGEKSELDADWAEAKAKIAIRIALEAIQFAQKAALEAVKAKMKATFRIK